MPSISGKNENFRAKFADAGDGMGDWGARGGVLGGEGTVLSRDSIRRGPKEAGTTSVMGVGGLGVSGRRGSKPRGTLGNMYVRESAICISSSS